MSVRSAFSTGHDAGATASAEGVGWEGAAGRLSARAAATSPSATTMRTPPTTSSVARRPLAGGALPVAARALEDEDESEADDGEDEDEDDGEAAGTATRRSAGANGRSAANMLAAEG